MSKFIIAAGFAVLLTGCSAAATPAKTVEVTPPTVTVAAEPVVKTVTRTVNKQVTPNSCLVAIDKAEEFADISVRYVKGDASLVKPGVQGSQGRGQHGHDCTERVNADIDGITAKTKALTAELGPVVKAFNAAKVDCHSKQ